MAAKLTRLPRDCRLAALAGILPDADGAGLLVDLADYFFGHKPTQYYPLYHHY